MFLKITYFTIRNDEHLRVWTRYGQTENERWVKWMQSFTWTKLHIFHTKWRKKVPHMNLWHRIAKRLLLTIEIFSWLLCRRKIFCQVYDQQKRAREIEWLSKAIHLLAEASSPFLVNHLSVHCWPVSNWSYWSLLFLQHQHSKAQQQQCWCCQENLDQRNLCIWKKMVKWELEEYLVPRSHYSSLLGFHFKGKDNRK